MKNLNGLTKLNETFNKVSVQIKKNSPAILVSAGVVGAVVSTVMACKATTKVEGILAESKKNIDTIHEAANNKELVESGKYTVQDSKKDLAVVYTKTGIELIKLYAPSVVLGALSVGSILASHRILNQRNLAITSAYAIVDKSFKDYRNRVKERYGEEVEREIKHNIKAKVIEKTVVDENGEEKKETETIKYVDENTGVFNEQVSEHARVFDESNEYFTGDAEYNMTFLKQNERYANDLLRARGKNGVLFLNEVYDMLGFQRTRAGQVVGWVNNGDSEESDGYVDFGLTDVNRKSVKDFINGYEQIVLLDFNVDGIVYDKLK